MDHNDEEKKIDILYGLEVRKHRDDLRITQKKLAKRIGLKQTDLSRYELGLKRCPEPIRMRIEKVLGPIDVFDDEDVAADPAHDGGADLPEEVLPVEQTGGADCAGTERERRVRIRSRPRYRGPWHKEFAELLLQFRFEYNLSQRDLSKLIGAGMAEISRWERLKTTATPETIHKVTRKIEELRQKMQPYFKQAEPSLHEDPPAVYDAAAAVRDNAQLPIEDVPESQPAANYKEYASCERDRQYSLAVHGLAELSNEAFYKLLDYLDDLKCNKKNLDSRFAGVSD